MASLCFEEAQVAKRENRITDREYLRHILAHYEGAYHDDDTPSRRPWLLDTFAFSVREVVLAEGFKPLEDISTLEKIFQHVFENNYEAAKREASKAAHLHSLFIQPLAVLAAVRAEVSLLKFCLEHGAHFEKNSVWPLNVSVIDGPKSHELLDLIYEYDFRHWRTKEIDCCLLEGCFDDPETVKWMLDHGARPYHRRMTVPPAATIRILLDRFGINWFHDSCALQFAARKGDLDVLTILLDAGADLEERPSSMFDVRDGGGPLTALIEAIAWKKFNAVRLLLSRGARVGDMALELARSHQADGHTDASAILKFIEARHVEQIVFGGSNL